MFAKHGFEITTFESRSSSEAIANVKLLREIAPKFENPYAQSRAKWNELAGSHGTSIGSGVRSTQSATTCKPKYTSY
jgi:hypothetical protein